MLFSSMTFIFMFLPIVGLVYFCLPKTWRNYWLLLASILFYAWGEPAYVLIMLLTILINYVGAILVDKYQKYKKLLLIGTVLVNLGILFYFKYFNFVMQNINALFLSHISFVDVIMPIGISFYTFQAISYVIDVYRGGVQVQKRLSKLALYICLFPQLIAGPIVKYHDIEDQIDNRKETFDKVYYGVQRFIIGLSKKMLIANTLGVVADKIFAQPVTEFGTGIAWLGALAYSLQLFYDFSGYSDMAIGLGSIFGFKFLENFNYPYISKSITEFWRRWHISLSTWFKEYLYIPLGGNRVTKKRNLLNLLIVFLATGIWHGAAWNFVVWGLWHGMFILIEKITGIHKRVSGWLLSLWQHAYTILAFVIGWVMFRSDNMKYAYDYIRNMFGLKGHVVSLYKLGYYIDNIEVITFIVAVLCAIPVFKNMINMGNRSKWYQLGINTWTMCLFVLSASAIAASTYNPFIYFRF
ncbi:MAG: MBOAT family protein [Proteobacteria bacterium]|nr:MBOAT family protein [Candidatus Enterousia onthequi]